MIPYSSARYVSQGVLIPARVVSKQHEPVFQSLKPRLLIFMCELSLLEGGHLVVEVSANIAILSCGHVSPSLEVTMLVENPRLAVGNFVRSKLVIEDAANVGVTMVVRAFLTEEVRVLPNGDLSLGRTNESKDSDYEGIGNGGHGSSSASGVEVE